MNREEEEYLRAVSLISWAMALREARAMCPQINSLSEFLDCCVNKMLNMCTDPFAKTRSVICADTFTSRQRALEWCRELEQEIVKTYYD
ncbi:MAG: hypothetical protein ACO2PN_12015 [Pyrobaculum sp.]